jgi:hypothetical protein
MLLCYDAIVRTTLDLSDEAYQIAKTVAREQNRSLGRVVSDFITGHFARSAGPRQESAGDFPSFRCSRRVTSEDVKALDDEP